MKSKKSNEDKEKEKFLKEFTSFVQDRGFIWGPSPEIYGGVAGFYTYGPMGRLLKLKVEESVRKTFRANDFWEIETPIVLPDIVWKASGHLDTFSDKSVECSKCKGLFRVDNIIEDVTGDPCTHYSDQQFLNAINKNNIKCPSCGGDFKYEIFVQNLMMKTKVAGKDSSLRPETATVTYLPFKRYYKFFRGKLPIGVFQIGKVFRNEISPRQHVIRGREFTQAEAQIFLDPDTKNEWERYEEIKNEKLPFWSWQSQESGKKPSVMTVESAIKKKLFKTKSYAWCVWLAYTQFINMGVPENRMRLRQHNPDEKAFYADDAWDIEIYFQSFGWTECCGVHDRTDYDLTQHEKFSKEQLSAVKEDGTKFKPHILEIAFGTDRPTLALLDIFYEKKEKEHGKTLFQIPYHLAPVELMIYPLSKKPELTKIAKKIRKELETEFDLSYDESGSIGKRYLRAAELGVPYCVTIDFDSTKKKDVTIRDRDSEKQIRVKISDLKETLKKLIKGDLKFARAGKEIKAK
ncbi:MAG: glycine--tRNA ligase [Nanoarchaeota archaeon]|nr:glycine--tRNA ligase [Nanoarchaeota archaeon]MCG2718946.1 glycine--tRNA ligase [Nanoarchaeota archaeon]